MARVIGPNEKLLPGDKLELEYSIRGPLHVRAIFLGKVEKKIESDPRFKYRGYRFEDDNTIIFRVDVVEPKEEEKPKIQQAGVGVGFVAALIATGGVLFIVLRETRLIAEATSGEDNPITAVANASNTAFKTIAILGVILTAYTIARRGKLIK